MKAKIVDKQVLNTISREEEKVAIEMAKKGVRVKTMEGLVEAVRKQNYFCPKIDAHSWDIYKLEKIRRVGRVW